MNHERLAELLRDALARPMSDDEREAQRQSYVRGSLGLSGSET